MFIGLCTKAFASQHLQIAMKEDGTGMSPENIKKAVGNPLRVKWAKVKYHHFSDMSGRTQAAILALPGGDIAEFINALDAMEEMTNALMTNADCKNYLQAYMKYTSKISFYMSTDTQVCCPQVCLGQEFTIKLTGG